MFRVKSKKFIVKKEQTLTDREFALYHCKHRKCKYRKAMRINKMICVTQSNLVFSICPRCGKAIEREYMKHCSSCGQKLSWADFDCVETIYK